MQQDSSRSTGNKEEDPISRAKTNEAADSPNDVKTGDSGPVTIYLEGEPTLTRCQLLQRHLQENNSLKYVAQCDEEGKFIPTQCYTPTTDQERFAEPPKCWCVDETGHKTQPTVYFTRGQRECGTCLIFFVTY